MFTCKQTHISTHIYIHTCNSSSIKHFHMQPLIHQQQQQQYLSQQNNVRWQMQWRTASVDEIVQQKSTCKC